MNSLNNIITDLAINFISIKKACLLRAINVENFCTDSDTFLFYNKGDITYSHEAIQLQNEQMLFIPANQTVSLNFGKKEDCISITYQEFLKNQHRYLPEANDDDYDFVILNIKTQTIKSLPIFALLDIPIFVCNKCENNKYLIHKMAIELKNEKLGYLKYVNTLSEQFVIGFIRELTSNSIFTQIFATNIPFLKDEALLKVFLYIKENLHKTLLNKQLADVAGYSDNYFAQYMKVQIGINPQDYIEFQRMNKAMSLIKDNNNTITEISHLVGFKEVSYFSRRFKLFFGIAPSDIKARILLKNQNLH